MKIDKMHNQYVENNVNKAREDKLKSFDVKKEKNVNIEISTSAKELVKKINQSEDSNFSEKVEKIRQSVLAGTYKVSSDEIADKILQTIASQKESGKS